MKTAGLFISVVMFTLALCFPVMGLAQDYVLGEGDLLNINVYDNPDLTTQARVTNGGAISFPLVGEVKVAGLSVRESEEKLALLLKDGLLRDPHVSVFVVEYRSRKVTMLGEVKAPGLYELNGNVTLVEMISKAGGLTELAGDTIIIQHRPAVAGGESEPESVDLKRLMENGDISANIAVQDGDSVFITKSGLVYVTGQVNRPGGYKLEKNTTVMKAIALAGGLTNIAAPGRTYIVRKSGSRQARLDAEMGDSVLPEDVINVPESYF